MKRIALARAGWLPEEAVTIPPSHNPTRCGCYDAMDDLYELDAPPLDSRYLAIRLPQGAVVCQPSRSIPCS